MKGLELPGGKKFAFSVFDDTDNATVENVKPVYDLLTSLGILTTKSVWVFPIDNVKSSFYGSQTLEDPEYLEFVLGLQKNGFEIAFHNAAMSSSPRGTTLSAIERFREILGHYPRVHVNHASNRENIYWGPDRLDSLIFKAVMNTAMKFQRQALPFEGHKPGSPYFWGDACQKHIHYCRNFVFREINLRNINPTMPYRDPHRPFIRHWFSACEGGDLKSFNKLLSSRNQARLEEEGGVCIVYTHFARGFVQGGKVQPEAENLLREVSARDGWFVPISTLLDHLLQNQPSDILPRLERLKMETRWLISKIIHGTS